MPYLFQTTSLVVSHLSRDLAKCNINTAQLSLLRIRF